MIPVLSVIVPTYNSAPTLVKLLDSFQAQTFGDFEVIVVDDASTDDTPALARQYDVHFARLPKNSGPAAARNHGASLATTDWLVFVDADMVLLPNTLAELWNLLQNPDVDAVVGTYAGPPANDGFVPWWKGLWEQATVEKQYSLDHRGLSRNNTWAPRPGIVRRAAFLAAGGFDESYRGADLEDMELGYRLVAAGHRIWFAPSVRAKHHYPNTVLRELRPFARRCALWMQMRGLYPQLDSAGEGSPRQAFAHLCGFAVPFGLIAGLLWWPILVGALAALLTFLALNMPFLQLARREKGCWFAVAAFFYAWLHSIVLGVAAAYGLARSLTTKRLA